MAGFTMDLKIKAFYRLIDHVQHYQLSDDETELEIFCLLLIIPFLAVGLGGQGKFTRWESSFWDLFLKAFVSYWPECKIMEEDQMQYASDKEAARNFFIPTLNKYREEFVAKKLRNCLQNTHPMHIKLPPLQKVFE